MNDELLLTLLQTPKIGRATVKHFLNNLKNDMNDLGALASNFKDLKKTNKRIHVPNTYELEKANELAKIILEQCLQNNIKPISIYDQHYPKNLKSIIDYPIILYAKGNSKLLHENNSVAVIGSRQPSETGLKLGKRLTEILIDNNFVIVSGLAIGCDTVAHETCIKSGGKTIAILPGGFDNIYPNVNKDLSYKILESDGLLLTEYIFYEKPRKDSFVQRNRIQSGISAGVCVIESSLNGGTMQTIKFAEEQNKIIGCVSFPKSSINDKYNIGNKHLINEGRACRLSNMEEIKEFISKIKSKNETIIS